MLTHNVWAADWRILITLLGWLTAIGGAARIVVPQGTQQIGRSLTPTRLPDRGHRHLARDRRDALLLRLCPLTPLANGSKK